MRTPTIAILALSIAAAAGGCRIDRNARVTVGADVPLEAFEPERQLLPPIAPGIAPAAPAPEAEPGTFVLLAPAPAPSLEGVERDHWEPMPLPVPMDPTYHHPRYAVELDYRSADDPPRGLYPTPLSAVEVPSAGGRGRMTETFFTPVLAVANAVAIVPWIFFESPANLHAGPQRPYERSWREPALAPVEPAEAPAIDRPPGPWAPPPEAAPDARPGAAPEDGA